MSEESLRFVEHDKIDKTKWDDCLANAYNGNFYGLSWVLDCYGRWDALVLGDYTYCMPLFNMRKFLFFKQLYQPLFSQQHGIYAKNKLTENIFSYFLQNIQQRFHWININLNENDLSLAPELPRKVNYILDLHADYHTIFRSYHKSLRKRVRQSSNHYQLGRCSVEELIYIYKNNIKNKFHIKNYTPIINIINTYHTKNRNTLFAVRNEHGEFGAAGFFPESHGRIYNIFAASTSEGRDNYAMHFLLDALIKQHSGTSKILDFEGSNIPSIATFFASFGATPHYYPYFQKKII